MNVWNLLSDAARRWPTQPAMSSGNRTLDYRTVASLATRMATRLHTLGIRHGDRVGCLMRNDESHLLAYFAIAAAGATMVSLNTRLDAAELRTILAHSGARLLLHDAAHQQLAAGLQPLLELGGLDADAATRGDEGGPLPLATAGEPAQIYYTSGTTGTPKGVVLTHGNVTTHAFAAIRELGLGQGDTWAHIAPMFHLADAWAIFAITAVGGRHVFLPAFTAVDALDLLVRERVTITNLVPTMLNLMVAADGAAARHYSLRVMLSGGAPIAPDVVRRILDTFGCDYVQTYGMTETSPYLTLSLLTAELRALPREQQLRWKCKTGRAFHGITLRVVDGDGQPVPADARSVGEVRVQGATVTPGYWQNPAATAAAFDDDGFLRTGDLATIDEHGYLDIVDRIKDVIKTGGETVYSVEVENVLYSHPAVLECAVFGVPDATWGERVTAAVVLRTDAAATADQLVAFCRDRIAHFKAPRQVRFLTALPRTGSGKITKKALRDAPA